MRDEFVTDGRSGAKLQMLVTVIGRAGQVLQPQERVEEIPIDWWPR
jgi:hypothetical protein